MYGLRAMRITRTSQLPRTLVLRRPFWSSSGHQPAFSGKLIATNTILKPFLTGAGYASVSIIACSFCLSAPQIAHVPWAAKFVTWFLTVNASFGVGVGVGLFSGIHTLLIDGRWLVAALPVNVVVEALSRPLSAEITKSLALSLQSALQTPSFVPRLVRPVWRFVLGQAIPLDALSMIPTIVLDRLKRNPTAALGAIVESVLLSVFSEGLSNIKFKYRAFGLSGVFGLFSLSVSGMGLIWGEKRNRDDA